MAHISVFESLSLDGYFQGPDGDLSWMYEGSDDPEYNRFSASNSDSEGILLMGRVTHDMMKQFWPTPQAAERQPDLARNMNARTKLVLSRTIESSDWSNTTVLADLDALDRQLASDPRPVTILGSGSVVEQLAAAGRIDAYSIAIVPVLLGGGRKLVSTDGSSRLDLQLSRSFANGRIFLTYKVRNV